jgi:hypothetical protein
MGSQAKTMAQRHALIVWTHLIVLTEPSFCISFIERVYITSNSRRKNDPKKVEQRM